MAARGTGARLRIESAAVTQKVEVAQQMLEVRTLVYVRRLESVRPYRRLCIGVTLANEQQADRYNAKAGASEDEQSISQQVE